MAFKTIGASPKRVDGVEKVTGSTQYTADMQFSNLLHIKVLRSPHAHARILDVDTAEASAMPGVVRIVTGRDVPGPFGVAVRDQDPIAKEKVRFVGEPVAAVVARSEREALRALKKIKIEYEQLPFVLDVWEAKDPSSPVLHEGLMDYFVLPYVHREGHNTYQHFKIRKGDAEAALAKADCVVEGEYTFPSIVHAQMEPHCTVARYGQDGSMVMYATTQAPFVVQTTIAELLEIPYNRIRVVAPLLGGGFGGKSDITIEALVACVARLVPGRYVRLLLSREELFSGTTHGRNASCRYKIGFDKGGKLLAMMGESAMASGGNADYAVNVLTGMASAGTGPYRVDDLKLDIYGVYTNTPPIGAARGYGHPEVHLAVESLMDVAAEKLGISPAAIRLQNLLRAGYANGIGQVMHDSNGNVVRCTEIIADKLFAKPKPDLGPHIAVGRGMASYMKTPCMPTNTPSGAFIKLNSDGTVSMCTGAVDMGQGLHTALAQIGAEALGLPFEKVHFQYSVDTLTSPYDWQTVASHSTWGAGNATILAAEDLKRKLREEGAKVFGVPAEEVIAEAGEVRYQDRAIGWSEFATGIRNPDGSALTKPVMGEGYFVPKGIQNHDPETGQGNAAADWTLGCVGAEVAVDLRTGEVTVLRLINAIDAGTIINPTLAKEQVSGAMLMAAGSVLSETVVFDEKTGRVRNNTLVDYKIPGIEDIPCETEVIFVQTPEESGPYGAKGIGEHGAVGTAPALLNAIYDATGLRFHTLPASADRITVLRKGGGVR